MEKIKKNEKKYAFCDFVGLIESMIKQVITIVTKSQNAIVIPTPRSGSMSTIYIQNMGPIEKPYPYKNIPIKIITIIDADSV